MNIDLPELKLIIEKLSSIENSINELRKKIVMEREWYDLKSACLLKGINYNTVISNPRYQPNFGRPDAVICGRKRWRRETILKWIEVTDDSLYSLLKLKKEKVSGKE